MLIPDNNTISGDFRGDPQVVPRMQAVRPSTLGVPAIVAYELRYGLMHLPKEAAEPRLAALTQWLRPLHMLPLDDECALQAAKIRITLEAAGTPIGSHDTLIAATALRHQGRPITAMCAGFLGYRACSGSTGTTKVSPTTPCVAPSRTPPAPRQPQTHPRPPPNGRTGCGAATRPRAKTRPQWPAAPVRHRC